MISESHTITRAAQPASSTPQLDLRRQGRIFWRWKWLFLLCVLTVTPGAYFLSASNTKVYQASAVMQVQPQGVDLSLFSTGAPTSATPPEVSLKATARLVATTAVAQQAARLLSPPRPTPQDLLNHIQVTPDVTTGLMTITASASTAARAAEIGNAYAQTVVTLRTSQAVSQLDSAIRQAAAQLHHLAASDVTGRHQLSEQLQRFRALLAAQGNNAQIIEPAAVPKSPVSPNPTRAAELGLLLAVLIGLGLVVVAENLDRRVRDASDLEEITGLPLLSTIPRSAFPNHTGSPGEAEAFHTLRASLTYFNIDRSLSSVVITSPIEGDGKTTVATKLAIVYARAGKDVVLLDADLRKAATYSRLGLEPEPGLGRVLVDDLLVGEALQELELEDSGAGRLRVLPGGPPPPNPSELLGSHRMAGLLDELESMCDLVIIDTSPVLILSDAMPLLERASGVVLVSQLNSTSRDALLRAHRVVESARGHTLGVVATGASGFGFYGYGYGYGEGYSYPLAGTVNGSTTNGARRLPSRWRPLKRRAAKAGAR